MVNHKIKMSIFTKMTTFLSLSSLQEGDAEPLRGREEPSPAPHRYQDTRIGMTAELIPVYSRNRPMPGVNRLLAVLGSSIKRDFDRKFIQNLDQFWGQVGKR
jgi:hypothetical protein